MLQVNLLGPPIVKWNNTVLNISRRQVRALLYCLAVRPEAIPREKLCFLFWSNTPDLLARRHLSHLLSHLRADLPDSNILNANKNNISLDPDGIWSDTTTFMQLEAAGNREALQQAVELYRGQFLSGFSLPGCAEFECWAADEGYHFENLYLGILSKMIQVEVNSGNSEYAITLAHRYLAVDNLAEGVHRKLIELYNITGNRSAAMEQFERCTVVLERELGVSPMPETRAVYEAALKNKPSVSTQPKIQASPVFVPGLQVPFVGRQTLLQELEQVWAQSKPGKPQVVLISGEAGIGKSRLIKEFVDHYIHETLILCSSCHPVKRPIPYQPLVEALSPVVNSQLNAKPKLENAHLAPAFPFSLSKTWLAEAARLLPDLYTLYPELPAPLPVRSDEARGRLFEALTRMVLDLANGTFPLCLVLDDLHWADKATLDWLIFASNYLHSRQGADVGSARLVIFLAYRTEEGSALAELRRNLVKSIGFKDLEVSSLSTRAVQHLVESLISSTGSSSDLDLTQLCTSLERVSGNNPFFIIETMRALLEMGLMDRDLSRLKSIPMADSLRLAVDERMHNLSSQARQVLEAGAVLNGVFGFKLLHLTAGRGELETIDGLEELTSRQFLVENEGQYNFRHDLIRQGVVDTLAPVRRQLLHRRAGYGLEKLQPEAVTALAYHFEKGNELEKALHYLDASARGAEQVFAWGEAEKHQTHMLAIIDQIDPECNQQIYQNQRAQILVSRAHLSYLQGHIEDRDKDLAALETLAKSGPNELQISAIMEKVRYLNLDSRFEEAIQKAQEGLALTTRLEDPTTAARLLTQIGLAHYFLGQPKPALKALQSVLVMTNDEPGVMMRGRVNHILGYVYFHLGDYNLSLAYQQQAVICHQQVNDLNRVAWDGLDIGLLYLKLGQLAESKRYLDEHLALTRRISAHPPEAYGLTLLGNWHLYQGDYAKAKEHFSQALNLQSALKSVQGCVAAEGGLGLSHYHLGETDQARQRLESAASRARSITQRRRLVEVLDTLGLVEITSARYDKACQCLQEAVSIARKSEFYEGLYFGLTALARAWRMTGEIDAALACAQEAVQIVEVRDLPMNLFWGKLELGLVYLAQGEGEAALDQIQQSIDLLPQAHHAWIGTEQVYFAHAKVLQALEYFDEAEQQLHEAEKTLSRKAELISDLKQRQRYLSFTKSLLSSVI